MHILQINKLETFRNKLLSSELKIQPQVAKPLLLSAILVFAEAMLGEDLGIISFFRIREKFEHSQDGLDGSLLKESGKSTSGRKRDSGSLFLRGAWKS